MKRTASCTLILAIIVVKTYVHLDMPWLQGGRVNIANVRRLKTVMDKLCQELEEYNDMGWEKSK